MANLKEIRTRISSVSSTMQITSAMKMVSAAKLRKAQDTVTGFKPYSEKLTHILADVSGSDAQIKYANKRDIKNVLIVVVSSNKGLCGAFNANVAKKAIEIAETTYKNKKVDFVTIGKKAGELIVYKGFNVKKSYDYIYDNLNFDNIKPVAEEIMNSFVEGEYDKVELIYNSFKNAASQNLLVESYLPVQNESDTEAANKNMDYIYEPDKAEILEHIVPIALKTQVYKAVIDSFASEHGARMTAMHKATDNATELLRNLTLTYNKARQAAITNEILEIVGGAEALNN